MNMRHVVISLSVFSIAAALIYFLTGLSNAREIVLKPDDLSVTSLGAKIYNQNCGSCHGANLEGEENWQGRDAEGRLRAPPHDATGHTWHHAGELLFRLTKYGPAAVIGDPNYATNMPAYEDILSDTEIIAVLSYIKSTWPPHIRARHDEMEKRR